MKKISVIIGIMCMALALSACGKNASKEDAKQSSELTETVQETEDTKEAETRKQTEKESEKKADVSKDTKAQTEPAETEKVSDNLVDGMRPEFKEAMDTYEEFMNEYCDFMNKYAASDGTDLGLLSDYADYMDKYADVVESFEAWDDGEMNNAEMAYYLDVQTRINKKLLEIAQ